MLFNNGNRILKDSLNVSEAKFYFYGHIATDKNHVFYSRKQRNDIDAASFHQIDDEIFEDKYYIYTHYCPVKVDKQFFEIIEIQSITWFLEMKRT